VTWARAPSKLLEPRMSLIHLHPDDNVAIASRDLAPNARIRVGQVDITLLEAVGLGHKVALRHIESGEPIVKFGQWIGFAAEAIEVGRWVHSHNLEAGQFARDAIPCSAVPPNPEPILGRTFLGYRRSDGKAGTRNFLAIVSNVNCSASVCKAVARRYGPEILQRFPNVDGVVAFTHGNGCGFQHGGEHHQILNRTMAGIARHPNIGGYILIGLGCEQATMGSLIEQGRLVQINNAGKQAGRPLVLSMQDVGGTQATIKAACELVDALLPRVNENRREPIPADELVLGTNCGGSDGNSGITANPALGVAADMIVAAGGTVVIGETTELFGAEHLLIRRARTPEIAASLAERIRWWQWYTGVFGASIDNNPSPGNKQGGITTIYEKSLGAAAKGGSTALSAVYQYAEPITAKGLVVMDTPGFDPVSVTGIVAGGAQVMVFTTGRGSCFGCKPTPSIKVATNTPMYERMSGDMDLNAGEILNGKSVNETGREIFEEIIAVASGKKTKSETLGIGDEEFVPWNIGPTL
jgi:altronate hydrolase